MSDEAFMLALQRVGASDPPTQEQLDSVYDSLQAELLECIADFGVAEYDHLITHAKAIRSRRR